MKITSIILTALTSIVAAAAVMAGDSPQMEPGTYTTTAAGNHNNGVNTVVHPDGYEMTAEVAPGRFTDYTFERMANGERHFKIEGDPWGRFIQITDIGDGSYYFIVVDRHGNPWLGRDGQGWPTEGTIDPTPLNAGPPE